MLEVNETGKGRDKVTVVEAAAVQLVSRLILLKIWQAADEQRLFQPYKSHEP